jgi:glycosyltransferase involved in cell wall biosynthesis
MKILMLFAYFPPYYSGAAKQGIALAKHLRSKGHSIEFMTPNRNNEPFAAELDGFKVWRIKQGRGRHRELVFWWNLFCFLWSRRKDFDILHSHGANYYNSIIGPLGKLFRMKSIVKTSMANIDLPSLEENFSGKLHLLFLKRIDAYVAISRELQNEFSALSFPSTKVYYLPNGVDVERFKPAAEMRDARIRQLLQLNPRKRVALTVGVFDRRKNIGWLINEWIKHNAFQTDAVLVAIGPQSRTDNDGSFLESLRQTAARHPHLVRIVDHVDNIENYFQAADFFVLPSTNEGMPNVVLEALAAGLPCITTSVSGCVDLIQEGFNGFMFSPNSPDELGTALARLLASDQYALQNNARAFIMQNHSLATLADRYESLYKSLMA